MTFPAPPTEQPPVLAPAFIGFGLALAGNLTVACLVYRFYLAGNPFPSGSDAHPMGAEVAITIIGALTLLLGAPYSLLGIVLSRGRLSGAVAAWAGLVLSIACLPLGWLLLKIAVASLALSVEP
jgi:hypothetical protein